MNLNLYILPGLKINICMCVCHFHSYMTILIFIAPNLKKNKFGFPIFRLDEDYYKCNNNFIL